MTRRPPNTSRRRGGFSLVEVLLGIFILGIGVIAVAALFPAGIAQQRQSVDDIIGPVVANNALSILRAKLKQEDFGTFEEFGAAPPLITIEGDWPWIRPGVAMADDSSTWWDDRGWYDVFSDTVGSPMQTTAEFPSGYAGTTPTLHGIPYNLQIHHKPVSIGQGERYYPTASAAAFVNPDVPRPKPQYVWDCMFRRYQGKILVAVFVYRVSVVGGGSITYRVPPNPSNTALSPLPISIDLTQLGTNAPWDAFGPDAQAGTLDDVVVPGTGSGTAYDASDQAQSWQEPRQWILDQNNNIHRVLSRSRGSMAVPVDVELVRPIPESTRLNTNWFPGSVNDVNTNGLWVQNIVSHIWYIPAEIQMPGGGIMAPSQRLTLTPIFATVKEL